MNLGKNYLVTGCSKGLGLCVTQTLLRNGHTVYGVSRSISDGLKQLKEEYPEHFFHLIFSLENSVEIKDKIFTDWLKPKTEIHGFVNNAATAYDDIITNLNLDKLKQMYEVNVYSPMMIVKSLIRSSILNRNQSSIVHISSISAHTGYKGLSMYASTKAALEGFSINTAREWGEKGIRSNCVVAGFMETEMTQTLSNEQKDRIYKRTSLKIPTDINSVAETVYFLLSEKSKSITGQNIHVDSGTI